MNAALATQQGSLTRFIFDRPHCGNVARDFLNFEMHR
jgi:hypothetical protein